MYLRKHKTKSSALILLFSFFLMREFSKHDVLFNTLFLAGLDVLGSLQQSTEVKREENEREGKS